MLAQRLEQLAEPDSVIVQGSVAETVPTRLPFDFESLGEQMLKGFDQPVRAFVARLQSGKELPAPDVTETSKSTHIAGPPSSSSFPGSGPTNLPNQLSSLVGRQQHLAAVRQALSANRLVTLTGAGAVARPDWRCRPALRSSTSLSTGCGTSSWGLSPILIWWPTRSQVFLGCGRSLAGRWSRR